MLDSLDDTKSKLARLHQTMEENAETLNTKEACQKIDTQQVRPTCLKQRSCAIPVEVPQENFWQRVPLHLQIQMQDAGDRYIVAIPAENVDEDRLRLEMSEDRQRLHVRGICLPTSEEVSSLQARVQARLEEFLRNSHSPHLTAAETRDLIAGWYAEAGRGSFGVFTETVRIPRDVNLHGIKATISEDTVIVVLPKVLQQDRSWLGRERPHMRFPAYRYGRNPFHNNFFADVW